MVKVVKVVVMLAIIAAALVIRVKLALVVVGKIVGVKVGEEAKPKIAKRSAFLLVRTNHWSENDQELKKQMHS